MTRTATRDPGYQRHCRGDRRPVLGATPAERLGRLLRLRALVGWDDAEAHRRARATYGAIGFEVLTGDEADELLATLAGATTRGA
jgi:hypothetical protein